MHISKEELKRVNENIYEDGYRLVYFYKDKYYIGTYSKTVEGFMIGLSDNDPIYSFEEIPKFISIDDLLNRSIKNLDDVKKVALYSVDGKLIAVKENQKIKINK